LTPLDLKLLEILYAALNERVGVTVKTNSVSKLRQRFYVVRREDPALACLSFHPSPVAEDELWIRKNEKETAD
jgi:hypothetical protein